MSSARILDMGSPPSARMPHSPSAYDRERELAMTLEELEAGAGAGAGQENVPVGPDDSSYPTMLSFPKDAQMLAPPASAYANVPAMYSCRVVHPCEPPEGTVFHDLPFLVLRVGDLYHVLQEAGNPSLLEGVPLDVNDRDDCLLLVRDEGWEVGWALATFLTPVD